MPIVRNQRHFDDAAHFKQTRAGAFSDTLSQRGSVIDLTLAGPLVSGIAETRVDQIGGGDERFALIAAGGDDRCDGVHDPVGDPVRAEIVEQEHIDFHRNPVGFFVARIGCGVVARTDTVQQILVIEEQSLKSLCQDGAKGRDSQMRFSAAGIAGQEQARLLSRRPEIRGR